MAARFDETRTFVVGHLVLFGVVLIGFGRTFYLRPFFIHNSLSTTLILHGVFLTAWFGFVVLQGLLISKRLRLWHARLAWLGVPVVAGVLITATLVNLNVAHDIESSSSPENMFVWANFMSLISFALLVVCGIKSRRNPASHQRLIFFASISIIGPAFARFAFWPAIGLGLGFAPVLAMAGMLALILIAVVIDLARSRRVMRATLAGLAGVITPLIIGTAVAVSGVGYSLLHQ